MPVYLKGISAEYSASRRLSQILSKITVSIKIYICCLAHFYRCSSYIISWNSRCFHSWVVHETDLLGVNIYFRIKKTRVTHIQPHYTPKWRNHRLGWYFFQHQTRSFNAQQIKSPNANVSHSKRVNGTSIPTFSRLNHRVRIGMFLTEDLFLE